MMRKLVGGKKVSLDEKAKMLQLAKERYGRIAVDRALEPAERGWRVGAALRRLA
jgi:hypothetical protein